MTSLHTNVKYSVRRILAAAPTCAGEQFTMDMVFAQSASENGNESSTL